VPAFSVTTHDSYPAEDTAIIDRGLGEANCTAAPLHEVQPISCFARSGNGRVIGGAVGRRWGSFCELQQLWVEPSHRRRGIGAELVRTFEAHARSHGCSSFYLETFNFQAPTLYSSLGYDVAFEHKTYPHGIVKIIMVKHASSGIPAG
jgi:ribosomal protein S18 acetylase RimI-like enzyme